MKVLFFGSSACGQKLDKLRNTYGLIPSIVCIGVLWCMVLLEPAEGWSERPCQTQFWELTTFTRYAGGFCLHLIRRNESLSLAPGRALSQAGLGAACLVRPSSGMVYSPSDFSHGTYFGLAR